MILLELYVETKIKKERSSAIVFKNENSDFMHTYCKREI